MTKVEGFYLVLTLKILCLNIMFNSIITIYNAKKYSIITINPFKVFSFHHKTTIHKTLNLSLILIISNLLRLLMSVLIISDCLSGIYLGFIVVYFLIYKILFLIYFKLYTDTSDKAQFFVLLGLLIGLYNEFDGIVFITLNVVMIYFFTGCNKLMSKEWRNGNALFMIMNTETYGNELIAKFFANNKKISLFVCWNLILVQLGFPFSLLNQNVCLIFLLISFTFHLFNLVILKLHSFFFLFISTYPCLYYFSSSNNLFDLIHHLFSF